LFTLSSLSYRLTSTAQSTLNSIQASDSQSTGTEFSSQLCAVKYGPRQVISRWSIDKQTRGQSIRGLVDSSTRWL